MMEWEKDLLEARQRVKHCRTLGQKGQTEFLQSLTISDLTSIQGELLLQIHYRQHDQKTKAEMKELLEKSQKVQQAKKWQLQKQRLKDLFNIFRFFGGKGTNSHQNKVSKEQPTCKSQSLKYQEEEECLLPQKEQKTQEKVEIFPPKPTEESKHIMYEG